MNSLKIIKEIVSNTTLKENMSLQMQLGLPFLDKKNNRLCMSFKPHLEKYADGNIEYYAPQYDLELVYPFKKIIKFINLSYEMTVDTVVPVAKVDAKELSSVGVGYMNELMMLVPVSLNFRSRMERSLMLVLKSIRSPIMTRLKSWG